MSDPGTTVARRRRGALTVLLCLAALGLAGLAGKYAGTYAARLANRAVSAVVPGDHAPLLADKAAAVSLYGTRSCPPCAAARRHLQEAGIAFNDLDLTTDAQALGEYRRLAAGAVPLLVTRRGHLVGFRPADIDTLIAPLPRRPAP
ncbi:glutaredoxin family protein [Pelomonas sp. APW6]|uniref:Glutaredoxin family protein n=1 Tax=Roseateles subflavus TaxID=3053353 RepID=A0ABT7LKM8_9BURK|nr:glutaredoxin family protein [Pelomonas sp. APW6]MDL5032994.1 glutaredoxin family protein [Pelomonas sp. APW6]